MNQLGYYGKIPHRGDFVRFNVPQTFVNVWDDWLQSLMLQAEQLYPQWDNIYSKSPSYRFVLSSGIAGNNIWIGVMCPSKDKVGRRFPFCFAMSLPELYPPSVCLLTYSTWYEDIEALLYELYSEEYQFDQLQADLLQLANRHNRVEPEYQDSQHTVANPPPDTLSMRVYSSEAFLNKRATPAILDSALNQLVGEYSYWECRQSISNSTILSSGLPSEKTGLALFTNDWTGVCSIDLEQLEKNLGTTQEASISPTHPILMTAEEDSETDYCDISGSVFLPSDDTITALQSQTEKNWSNDISSSQKTGTTTDSILDDEHCNDATGVESSTLKPQIETLELDDEDLPDAPWDQQ